MIKAIIINIAIIISYLFIIGQFSRAIHEGKHYHKIFSRLKTQVSAGLLFAALGVILLAFPIPVTTEVTVDLSLIAIVIAALFFSAPAAIVSALFIALSSMAIVGSTSGIGFVGIGVVCALLVTIPLKPVRQAALIIIVTGSVAAWYLAQPLEVSLTFWLLTIIIAFISYYVCDYIFDLNKAYFERKKANEKLQELVLAHEEMEARLQEANSKLLKMANIDGLTGIANRRSFNDTLEKETKRMKREKKVLSLLMIDIDNFKAFNDTYGHQEGDYCLQSVANEIKGNLQRPSDFVARYGGEEFAVILPGLSENKAAVVAEKIRSSIEELEIPNVHAEAKSIVTISVGVATMDEDINSEQLVKLADRALYEAKERGRNQVCQSELTLMHTS
ncbi:GGDEF domain-containing protein [Lottiidibacillus patelloidae]|nr:GGDEF domain-containing protein [Lottiidibacillus patelloidae]